MGKYDEMNGCGNCTKLRWNRKRMGLDHEQFADKVGVNVITIRKLESDESAWDTLPDSILDKIVSCYASMSSWQPERPDKVLQDINEVVDVVEEPQNLIKEEPLKTNTFGKCERLKQARKNMGLSQMQLADKIGVAQPTISKLERDETAWGTLHDSTVDKIMSFYAGMSSYKPGRSDKVMQDINEVNEEQVENVADTETIQMSKCDMLLTTRRKLGMTQAELSVKVGINEKTIRRLEKEETAWGLVRKSTVDKIMKFCSNTSSYKSDKPVNTNENPIIKEEPVMKPEPVIKPEPIIEPMPNNNGLSKQDENPIIKEEPVMKPEPVIKPEPIIEPMPNNNGLSKQDEKILTLVEFAYEELTQATTHDDFEVSIQMLKKIVNRY